MPIGDPGGCNFEYTTEGLPLSLAFAEIPVKDISRATDFYCSILKLEKVSADDTAAVLRLDGGGRIVLKKSRDAGKDTGLFLRVVSPFEFNRRMVDDGVVMIRHPQRGPLGVYASFLDSEGNTLHVIEGRSDP
ncbi:MAG: glyoxalase [Methanomassiliicoccaceae archaeon]|nr:glyoxalase [Methanomassiliicoccaceae archaeon]